MTTNNPDGCVWVISLFFLVSLKSSFHPNCFRHQLSLKAYTCCHTSIYVNMCIYISLYPLKPTWRGEFMKLCTLISLLSGMLNMSFTLCMCERAACRLGSHKVHPCMGQNPAGRGQSQKIDITICSVNWASKLTELLVQFSVSGISAARSCLEKLSHVKTKRLMKSDMKYL